MKKFTLDQLIFFTLGLFAFSVIFSVTAVEAALFLTLALLLVKKYGDNSLSSIKPALTSHPLFIPWMVYLAVCLLTTLTAYYPAKGFGQLNSDFLKYVCLSTLLLSLKKEHLPKLTAAYTSAAVISALIGITAVFKAIHANAVLIPRATAFMNIVRYGEVLAIALIFILARILSKRDEDSGISRYFYIAAAAVIFTALVLSQTRGAYLGFAVGLACMFVLGKNLRLRMLILGGALSSVWFAVALFNPAINNRFTLTEKTTAAAPVIEEAAGIRIQLWKVGWTIIKAHPILGIGPGNMRAMFNTYKPDLVVGVAWGSLHNLYIQQTAERGIIGLAALLALFASFQLFALRLLKTALTPYTLWASCVLPAYFAMNITEISFQHVHTAFAVFLAIAAAAASSTALDKP